MTGPRGWVAAALLVAVMAQPGPATVATAEPADRPIPAAATPADVPDAPEEVAAWFAEQGAEAADAANLGAPDDLAVGLPRQVATWNEDYIAGAQPDAPAELVDRWIAPVMLQSEDLPEPAGVVHAAADGGGLELVEVTDDAELAAELYRVPGGAVFIYDDLVEGWFATLDGEVWSVTEEARTLLQGSLSTEIFQELLAGWRGESAPTAPPVPEEDPNGAVSPLVPIGVIVVIGAGVAWLLLRQYRRADSRIAADVHAGLTPPRGIRIDEADTEPEEK